MKFAHKTFLDIEQAIAKPVRDSWIKLWGPAEHDLKRAINGKKWAKAEALIDDLDTQTLVLGHAKRVGLLIGAAYLLGVSRVRDIDGHQLTSDDTRRLGNALAQWGFMVGRNLPMRVKRKLHLKLALLEHKIESKRHVFKKAEEIEEELEDSDPEVWTEVEDMLEDAGQFGINMNTGAASLVTSRVSNYGALSQLYSAGKTAYMISEILDDATCEVCEAMDGQIFPIEDGIRQATAVMDCEDPDSLADIAPWPDQDDDSVSALHDSNTQDLVDQGLQLPPYHPCCRGITVDVDDEEANAGARTQDVIAEAGDDIARVSTDVLAQILGFTSHALSGKDYTGLGVLIAPAKKPVEDLLEDAASDYADEHEDEEDEDQTPAKKKKPGIDPEVQ